MHKANIKAETYASAEIGVEHDAQVHEMFHEVAPSVGDEGRPGNARVRDSAPGGERRSLPPAAWVGCSVPDVAGNPPSWPVPHADVIVCHLERPDTSVDTIVFDTV